MLGIMAFASIDQCNITYVLHICDVGIAARSQCIGETPRLVSDLSLEGYIDLLLHPSRLMESRTGSSTLSYIPF